MNAPHENRRIFWMVRLLVAVGLTTIIVLIGLVGRQIASIRTDRVKLDVEKEMLNQVSDEILRRSSEARAEIIAILDDNVPMRLTGAATHLQEMIYSLAGSTNHPFTPDALNQLDVLIDRQAEVERQALTWRAQHDAVEQDVRQQQTLGRARALITGLRGAVDTALGRQRLQDAIQVKCWRAAHGQEAASLAQAILTEQDQKQNPATDDLERDLAEIESLVELPCQPAERNS